METAHVTLANAFLSTSSAVKSVGQFLVDPGVALQIIHHVTRVLYAAHSTVRLTPTLAAPPLLLVRSLFFFSVFCVGFSPLFFPAGAQTQVPNGLPCDSGKQCLAHACVNSAQLNNFASYRPSAWQNCDACGTPQYRTATCHWRATGEVCPFLCAVSCYSFAHFPPVPISSSDCRSSGLQSWRPARSLAKLS
jgi:hypothetical protein